MGKAKSPPYSLALSHRCSCQHPCNLSIVVLPELADTGRSPLAARAVCWRLRVECVSLSVCTWTHTPPSTCGSFREEEEEEEEEKEEKRRAYKELVSP